MGVPLSVLGKLGLPSVNSLTTDKVYERFFKNINNYPTFHTKFIEFCSEFNRIMPGKHYILKADIEDIKKLYDDWKEKPTDDEQKKLVVEFLNKSVEEYKPSSTAMIATGLVVPGAAVVLKNKSSQMVPQLKMLRLDLVPNAVFVPTVTLLSLIGVRMVNLSKAPTKLASKAGA